MADAALPDDINDWPNDPYRLLKVRHNVDAVELRHAYVRLIKIYKPERAPEEFRRIREGYDAILEQIRWRFLGDSQSEDSASQDADTHQGGAEPGNGDAYSSPLPPAPSLEHQVAPLWQQACGGEIEAAYFGLVEIERQHPGDVALCVRLYWLLKLWPELQPERSALEWLAATIGNNELADEVEQLYAHELIECPELAQSAHCRQLLESIPDRHVAWLAELRWQAAGWLGDLATVRQDLEMLRPRLSAQFGSLWPTVVLYAARELAWGASADDRDYFASVMKDLERLHEQQPSVSYGLDRLEYTSILTQNWSAIAHLLPVDVARFLHVYLHGRYGEIVGPAESLAATFVKNPQASLKLLDGLPKLNSTVLVHLWDGLQILENDARVGRDAASRDTQGCRELLMDFCTGHWARSYLALREDLLDFCLAEAISPQEIGRFGNETHFRLRDGTYLAEQLATDYALQSVYMAHALIGFPTW